MIISIDTTDSNIRIEHKHENVDMSLDEVFSLLVEPALLGLGFQKGSILDACESYINENSEEFITQSRTNESKRTWRVVFFLVLRWDFCYNVYIIN